MYVLKKIEGGGCAGCYFTGESKFCTIIDESKEFRREFYCTRDDESYIVVKSIKRILKKL